MGKIVISRIEYQIRSFWITTWAIYTLFVSNHISHFNEIIKSNLKKKPGKGNIVIFGWPGF